ncbi:hypothetical protein [Mycolicibacterium litorale]|uniref:hypothetical protein n=1 Tax=Mycolicibacterium litorale TaxID=758802 RepID=UPI0039A1457F
MIGRDRITINFRRKADNTEFSRSYYGTVVTERLDGKLEPFGGKLVFSNFYRLILPRTLNVSDASIMTVSFGTREHARLDSAITPVYDARGGIRHYEAIVRAH